MTIILDVRMRTAQIDTDIIFSPPELPSFLAVKPHIPSSIALHPSYRLHLVTMLEVSPPTRIPMFPANYREFLLTPGAPAIPAAQQTLLPGQIFQLAQPKWPIDNVMPSFYMLAATTIFSAFFLVAFKDIAALINYELRTRLGIAGNPMVGMTLSLLAFTMLLITYENDIKKRSGYYSEGSDPRYMVGFSAFASFCAVWWASSTFQTPVAARDEKEQEEKKAEAKEAEVKGSRRQQKKQAKREAKKTAAQ